jgi:FMN phosphatase YigB (HAD superfamily)
MKPDPRIFEYLKEKIEWADYDEIVFVGDNLKIDIE